MTCSIAEYGELYTVAKFSTEFSISNALRHVALFCHNLTPQYGISHVMSPSSSAYFFLGGASTVGMNAEDSHRANYIGWYLRDYNIGNASYDKLIDIFELNVLNAKHLERQVFGQSLASWIRNGNGGELVEINSKVAVWLVPDEIRPAIRRMFFDAGLIETALSPQRRTRQH